MKNDLRLVIPALSFMPSYIEALKEGHRCGASPLATAEQIAGYEADPQSYLDALFAPQPPTWKNDKGEEFERVPMTTMWLVEGDSFIGDAKIRHRLNAQLEQSGGHIGYGVRPSLQGKGMATELLRHCLVFAQKELQLPRVLLSCKTENIASARVIEKNGGELIDITPHPYDAGKLQKRFWIKTYPTEFA